MGFLAPDVNGQPYAPDVSLLESLAGLPPKERVQILLACPDAVVRSSTYDIHGLIATLAEGL
jgi:hypothetical protein